MGWDHIDTLWDIYNTLWYKDSSIKKRVENNGKLTTDVMGVID